MYVLTASNNFISSLFETIRILPKCTLADDLSYLGRANSIRYGRLLIIFILTWLFWKFADWEFDIQGGDKICVFNKTCFFVEW